MRKIEQWTAVGVLLLGAGLMLAQLKALRPPAPAPRAPEEAPPAHPPPPRFIPVSRADESVEFYIDHSETQGGQPAPRYGEVVGHVVDKQGRPVARGFVSFPMPRAGWCGNERSGQGRVPIIEGQFRARQLTSPEEFRVVAEDGRSARVSVSAEPLAPGAASTEKRLEVTLPNLPPLAGVSGEVLPWAQATTPPYRMVVIATRPEGAPGVVPTAVREAYLHALQEQGFSARELPLEPARQGVVLACHEERTCLRSVLPEVSAEGLLMLSARSPEVLDYVLVPFAPVAPEKAPLRGTLNVLEAVRAVVEENARDLARTVLTGGRWGALRTGAPSNACEYVYGARFETARRVERGFGVATFNSRVLRDPGLTGDIPGMEQGHGALQCEGWNLVFRDGEEHGRPRLYATIDPSTGRMKMGDTVFLWAGALEADEW